MVEGLYEEVFFLREDRSSGVWIDYGIYIYCLVVDFLYRGDFLCGWGVEVYISCFEVVVYDFFD